MRAKPRRGLRLDHMRVADPDFPGRVPGVEPEPVDAGAVDEAAHPKLLIWICIGDPATREMCAVSFMLLISAVTLPSQIIAR